MALSKIDVANMLTGSTPVANGGTALTSGFVNGVSGLGAEVDSWRISSDFTNAASPITTWERVDTSFDKIGTGLTHSSGIFTFPSTGIYLVLVSLLALPDGVRQYVGHRLYTTANNSSYSIASESVQHTTATNNYISSNSNFIVDVSNTSNVKVKLAYASNGSADVLGNSGETYTGMTFIRLGDT